MAAEKENGDGTKPGRRPRSNTTRDWRPGHGPERLEGSPPPRRASGDPATLVGIDNPDDVDLYRHPGPPPGFTKAGLAEPPKRTQDKPSREDDPTERQ